MPAAAAAAAAAYPGALASFDDEPVLGVVAVACTKGKGVWAAGLEPGVLFSVLGSGSQNTHTCPEGRKGPRAAAFRVAFLTPATPT